MNNELKILLDQSVAKAAFIQGDMKEKISSSPLIKREEATGANFLIELGIDLIRDNVAGSDDIELIFDTLIAGAISSMIRKQFTDIVDMFTTDPTMVKNIDEETKVKIVKLIKEDKVAKIESFIMAACEEATLGITKFFLSNVLPGSQQVLRAKIGVTTKLFNPKREALALELASPLTSTLPKPNDRLLYSEVRVTMEGSPFAKPVSIVEL